MNRRKWIGFDAFDKLCAEGLEEDARMAEESRAFEEEQAWADYDRVFLGATALGPESSPDPSPLPEPPEAA